MFAHYCEISTRLRHVQSLQWEWSMNSERTGSRVKACLHKEKRCGSTLCTEMMCRLGSAKKNYSVEYLAALVRVFPATRGGISYGYLLLLVLTVVASRHVRYESQFFLSLLTSTHCSVPIVVRCHKHITSPLKPLH